MKILNARVHGALDFVVVLLFAIAPTVLSLSGTPALLAYALAGVHLSLTLLTDFPMGILKWIPFKIHGLIELIVGPVLVACPWVFGFSGNMTAKIFYIAFGAVIFVTWLVTDYRETVALHPIESMKL